MDQALPSTSSVDETSTNSQACILLVEDDRSVRRYLEVTLLRSGYRVLTAGDGLEAMRVAMSASVDVVITDAIMPNISGQQLAAFLRKNSKLSGIPIVLLTGQENREAAAIADGSIDAFLNKPVKAEELRSCIEQLISRSRTVN